MMTTVRFRRARRREMRTIVKERAERPSHLMTYGDWPPPPPPPAARKQPKLKLWQRALADVAIFALIWAGGAVAILIVQAAHH
jgi:hypothetical protein